MNPNEVLKKLHQIQLDNIGIIDCEIQTRKDKQSFQIVFSACDYKFDSDGKIDKQNKSKLYIHKFKWDDIDYSYEFGLINNEIEMLKDIYE